MEELLGKICQEKQWAAVYCNHENLDSFLFGRILYSNDVHTVMLSTTQNGAYEGLVLRETDSIFRVETDSQYNQKMLRIMQPGILSEWIPVLSGDDLILSLLVAA